MILHIASNLKRLRKERELTQEDLADFLGVSFQAVSKWERDEGYPDITILPAIANFFEVTLDDLVGMNEIKDASDIQEINNQVTKYENEGNIDKAVEILRDAVKRYPNNYDLLADLAYYLGIIKKHDEAIEISERILKFCTDQKIRSDVQCNVCFDYHCTSLAIKSMEYNREWGEPTGGQKCRKILLQDLESEDRYECLCENEDFIKIKNKLK